ncbi:MAG TPA: IS1634 family transposase, partial [bacterium]|nr:IS1634 family transposase [bacterium]
MHIQRNKVVYKGKVYRSILLRQCYYEKGKIKQKTIANLSKMPEYLIRSIELAIKRHEISYKIEDLEFEKGVDFGDIGVLYEIMREEGLDEIIYSKKKKERELVLMMIIGRILHPGSKLENTRWIKARQEAFKEYFKLDYDRLRVDDLYEAMDWLIERKSKIEARLYEKRGSPILFLYDITSSYFEGEKSEISEFGYNRDKKEGKKQIVMGLVLDKEGYPISIEVFRGNVSDQSTIKGRIEEMKRDYGIEKAVLIGDRGMITETRMDELEKEGFDYITCLTHRKIEELVEEKDSGFYPELFDEKV